MKVVIILAVVVLLAVALNCYFAKCKDGDCSTSKKIDSRVKDIKRAKKNLHPKINVNVDRDKKGRYCKKK